MWKVEEDILTAQISTKVKNTRVSKISENGNIRQNIIITISIKNNSSKELQHKLLHRREIKENHRSNLVEQQ